MKKFCLILILFFVLFVTPSSIFAATLTLSPASGTYNRGCSFSIDVALDTQGVQTDGTDAIIMYDQSKFTATTITSGTIYADYPGNNIDDSKGVITTSGLASISSPFSGQGTLATINFKVKDTAATGATQVTFDFTSSDKTKTTDSNVVQRGGSTADVLSSVTNGSYTVGTGACGQAGSPATILPRTGGTQGGTPSAVPQKTLDEYVDNTGKGPGTPQLTYTIAIVGSILTVLGILGIALL